MPVTPTRISSAGMMMPSAVYLQERRRALGGYVPERRGDRKFISLPGEKAYESVRKGKFVDRKSVV